jgi:hypothetical protein
MRLRLAVTAMAAVAFLAAAGGSQADTATSDTEAGVTVAAVDGSGNAIDVPYYSQGALNLVGPYDDGSGTGTYYLAEVRDTPEVAAAGWQGADGGNRRIWTFIGSASCNSDAWPFHTSGPYSTSQAVCWRGDVDPQQTPSPAVWVVRVPLTATDGSGQQMIFDHFDGPPPDRCRTGDMGKVENWDRLSGLNVIDSTTPGSFSVGAEYRFWGGPGTVTAHYVLASAPDKTAPLIEVTSPIDCQPVQQGAQVPVQFSCDDQGGSGVASCLLSGDIASSGNLDTSTPGWHQFTITAKDNDGNTRTRTLRYLVDGQPPTVSFSPDESGASPTGWFNSASVGGAGASLSVTVTFGEESGGSGMHSASCTLDGQNVWNGSGFSPSPVDRAATSIVWQTPAPQTFSIAQGTHTLSCTASDWSGHTTSKSVTYKVDSIPPPQTEFYETWYLYGDPSSGPPHFTCPGDDNTGFGSPASYAQGSSVSIEWWLYGGDAGSGLVSPTTTTGYTTLDTSTLGSHITYAPSTVDAAGNLTLGEACPYSVYDATPPTVSVVAAPVAVNTPETVSATLDDGSGSGVASAEISTDGGVTWNPMSGDFGGDSATASASVGGWPSPQVVNNVCVRATDLANNTSPPSCVLIAVYDPSAGFVTGGGWINSPAGADTAAPSLTGKATFGFVSKYQKGATAPTGSTEFEFKVGNLDFHSDVQNWLIVNQNSTNAQFKGSGTINGAGDYQFMIWATDGSPDTFRIQITDGNTVIYDNGSAQPIGGGSIIVHK